ncbi:unnamed protein product [Paramecium octaurelia]|uniref:Tubulin-tyrosine ligase family protein n=1 Tax=Paramecium octaurelia TaxID=43137 RepID=A0A8S1V7I1_PAROT|nr:unnamed protein product [Paramecium octaurelia]
MEDQNTKKDFHTRNLDIIAQLREKKMREQEEKEMSQKRKQDLVVKLKSRYVKEEQKEIKQQVSLPSINTPESSKNRQSSLKKEDLMLEQKMRIQEKQRQYLESIKTRQLQEKQKKEEMIQRQEIIKQSVKQKVLNQLSEVAQFVTKDDLLEQDSGSDDQDAQKVKLKKYPFITDLKQWKKKQRIDDAVKVFIMVGGYGDIAKALIQRGWVKNPDSGSPCFDFKFTLHNSEIDYNNLQDFQIVNHFAKIICLTTKVGLCKSLNNLIWFNNVDKNTFYPRAFDLSDEEDFENFREEFKLSKAEAILKMYLHLFKKKDANLIEKIKPQAIVALSVCRKMLQDINELIDQQKQTAVITQKEWDILSKDDLNVQALAQKKHQAWLAKIGEVKPLKKKKKSKLEKEQDDSIEDVDEFTQQIIDILQSFKNRFPQYYLNGVENIWIVKPAGLSRGRGIQCYKNLVEIEDHVASKGAQWIIQKYIEKPLIVLGKKMDIRQWVLITDWNPLTIWIYDEAYLRFTAEEYDPKDLENKMSHLTNNSIQKKGENFYKSDIEGNMWNQEQFSDYLMKTHQVNFMEIIRPQFEQAIIWSLQSVQDQVEQRKNSHEILGYDFMIDDKFHVWLIEINSSPDFSYSTHVTEKLVKEVSEDLIKVVIDRENDKKCDTGKFKRIYKAKSVLEKPASVGLNLCLEGKKIKKVKG